jgi:signal transduction histidine kinase
MHKALIDMGQWFRLPRRLLAEFLAISCLLLLLVPPDHWIPAGLLIVTGGIFVFRAIRSQLAVSRLQTDFLYALSHELRTPLTSMRQLTEALATGRTPSEARRQTYYEVLHRESETLVRLVERLLDFGRVEAGVLEYRFELLNAGEVVGIVVAEFQQRVADLGYSIHLENGAQGCTVKADRDALSRSLWNLLDNAVKHSPDCKTVWVTAGRARNRLLIEVRDQGVGIPKQDQKRIFNFFVRGQSSTSVQAKGTGLGLAIVDILIQAHGGKVRVESAPGEGSKFTISLPVSKLQ